MTRHIVLLGDSIFDNGLYVPGGPSVIEHVRRILPDGDRATMIALDGATVSSVFGQLERIPNDAIHLVLNAGGNDALWMAGNIFSKETAGLCVFNDTITRTAFEFDTTHIDLRTICNEPLDYSSISPIEPSACGGGKIARAIMNALSGGYEFRRVVG